MGEGMKFINGEVESLKQTLNVRKDEIDSLSLHGSVLT